MQPPNIDFSRIRTGGASPNAAFEELVCQIARRGPPQDALEFRRIHGAGGDGGVEAYWVLGDGREVGFQAKYHLRCREVDWSAIDDSVKVALATHPRLVHYAIAIPCNFTDQTGATAKSQTGWEKWAVHKQKWQGWAGPRHVHFEAWTQFELAHRLSGSEFSGLVTYWFDVPRFTPAWFTARMDSAVADLEERYHPEDHVDVSASTILEGLVRDERLRARFTGYINEVRKAFSDFEDDNSIPALERPPGRLADIGAFVAPVLAISEILAGDPNRPWAIPSWRSASRDLAIALRARIDWLLEVPGAEPEASSQGQNIRRARSSFYALDAANEALYGFLGSAELEAESTRKAIILGAAGSGKSHLVADYASKLASMGRPVLVLLGQHFGASDPWPQILSRLDLSAYTRTQLLGALDCAAESLSTRALVVIDALNEGAGLQVWRNFLGGFLSDFAPYRNISVCVTCRSDYAQFVAPPGGLAGLVQVECRGFATSDEREGAARKYFDRRGIVRPATPWLSPEFTNPLFLRTTVSALNASGQTEFPRGLHGTKTLYRYFLEAVARRLDPRPGSTADLLGPTIESVKRIASEMAIRRRDCLPAVDAERIVSTQFATHGAPDGRTWLDILCRSSVLRRDLDPETANFDGMDAPREVVRFTFQRFSDHLVAEALLHNLADISGAFEPIGELSFLIEDGSIVPQFTGWMTALAQQVPEVYGVELVDQLPGGIEAWWERLGLQDGFVESLLFRRPESVSARAVELLAKLRPMERFRVAMQLAAVQEHPLNADWLDSWLRPMSLPERDQAWSVEVARADHVQTSPARILIEWTWHAEKAHADDETLRLASVALCWLFTCTNRRVRDRATKSLSALLVQCRDAGLGIDLLRRFASVNDPYLVERLLAALLGFTVNQGSASIRLALAEATYSALFAVGRTPPVQLLTRDYALGIVEAASSQGQLPSGIDLARCRPPFNAEAPGAVTDAEVKGAADAAGDDHIFWSCTAGDFANYEIEPTVRNFTNVPLWQPAPIDSEEAATLFESEITSGASATIVASYQRAKQADRDWHSAEWQSTMRTDASPDTTDELARLAAQRVSATSEFRTLLNDRGRSLFDTLLGGSFTRDGRRTDLTFSSERARLWVGKRAYGLGWTKAMFGDENWLSYLERNNGHDRPVIERISKKYQWIALDELLARLSDRNWVRTGWPHRSEPLHYSTDLGFVRDIDPTALHDPSRDQSPKKPSWWIRQRPLPDVSDSELLEWPFRDNELESSPKLIDVSDADGHEWLVLYSFVHQDERLPHRASDLPFRRSLFTRVSSVIVHKADEKNAVRYLKGRRLTDPTDWEPPDVVDRGFLLETPWRGTWEHDGLESHPYFLDGIPALRPVRSYLWESHLDEALPEGLRAHVPAPWLARKLEWRQRPLLPQEYVDRGGRTVFKDPDFGNRSAGAAFVDRSTFIEFLERESLVCLWIVAGERRAWLNGSREHFAERAHGAVYRLGKRAWLGKSHLEDDMRQPAR